MTTTESTPEDLIRPTGPIEPRTKPDKTRKIVALVIIGVLVAAFAYDELKPKTGTTHSTSAMTEWYGDVNTDFRTIATDLNAVGTIASNATDESAYDTVGSSCSSLSDDVDTLAAHPAPPNAEIAPLWASMLGHLSSGARLCVSAGVDHDPALLDRSTAEISSASSDINAIAAKVPSLKN